MSGWDELVASALLGTQRRAPSTAGLPGPVAALLPGGEDPAAEVLTAAALMTGYRRAGITPVREGAAVPAADTDQRPLVPSAARHRLSRMLAGDHGELLDEWLALIASVDLRVPPENLPALADAARTRVALRRHVAVVAGPRAAWLGALRPEWTFLAEHADPVAEDQVWEFGSTAQRSRWLEGALASDPAAARAALAAAWPSEPAQVRLDFLSLLGAYVEPGDEPFLEAALDDRAQDVRGYAADLLAGMPNSALGARMQARLEALVTLRRKALRRDELVIELPAECPAGLQRDGVLANPRQGGQRAWWLRQIVAATPLSAWLRYAPDPVEVHALAVDGCDASLLREAWAIAAVRQRDVEWARALLAATPSGPGVAGLVALLPPAEWAGVLDDLAAAISSTQLADLVVRLPRPWPVEFGTALLDWLAGHTDQRAVATAAVAVARSVPRACLDHPLTAAELDADAAPWRRRLVETLSFRREMYEELS